MRVIILVAIFVLLSGDARAWGDTGHKIVCEIACRLIGTSARSEIRRLMKGDDDFDFFRDACTWPDHPRKRHGEHYVNLPRDSRGLSAEACPAAAKCVLTGMRSDFEILASRTASDEKKLDALKFLGHWVGDIHQPLHVSFEDDRGGGNISVSGECTGKFHGAWDTCLVQKAVGEDVVAAAIELIKSITPAKQERWIDSEPLDWANESFKIAVDARTKYCVRQGSSCALPPSESVTIDKAYVDAHVPVVREQLQKAGVRLAHLLDAALER